MTVIQRTALLPYTAEQVYALVDDIEAYPTFMDGCVGAQILSRTEAEVEARLNLAQKGISQSFSTRNRLLPSARIDMELLEGPFKTFSGRWQFQALGDTACKVSLDLAFTLNSKVLSAAAAKLFDSLASHLVDSISQRAKQLYE